ncbi:hypothetical protein BX666DRAFT_1963083 [Dichotomocladium elegans]|nr:hypothetical protein BX666DRAFT_1963083 [Dichotomocladium elegans]
MVDEDVKLIIQQQERSTKYAAMSPLHRFATFANLPAHYDCDFAPKNAGVYFNFEYFQLFLAYRDLEMERQQQHQQQQRDLAAGGGGGGGDPRPVLVQCRADIEKVLVNTNWEAIRRRLTIGERICQVCGIVGRGFLLLSKQVSGRKLLHNFNTGEWAEFMHEFHRPENQAVLQTLKQKYSPERFYGARPAATATATPGPIQAPSSSPSASPSASPSPLIPSTEHHHHHHQPQQQQPQQQPQQQIQSSPSQIAPSHHHRPQVASASSSSASSSAPASSCTMPTLAQQHTHPE